MIYRKPQFFSAMLNKIFVKFYSAMNHKAEKSFFVGCYTFGKNFLHRLVPTYLSKMKDFGLRIFIFFAPFWVKSQEFENLLVHEYLFVSFFLNNVLKVDVKFIYANIINLSRFECDKTDFLK